MPRAEAPLNSLGLPLRSGAIPCPFYVQHGACQFGSRCRYTHPEREARVDYLLVQRGHCKTKADAKELVKAGHVRTGFGEVVKAPGQKLPGDARLALTPDGQQLVRMLFTRQSKRSRDDESADAASDAGAGAGGGGGGGGGGGRGGGNRRQRRASNAAATTAASHGLPPPLVPPPLAPPSLDFAVPGQAGGLVPPPAVSGGPPLPLPLSAGPDVRGAVAGPAAHALQQQVRGRQQQMPRCLPPPPADEAWRLPWQQQQILQQLEPLRRLPWFNHQQWQQLQQLEQWRRQYMQGGELRPQLPPLGFYWLPRGIPPLPRDVAPSPHISPPLPHGPPPLPHGPPPSFVRTTAAQPLNPLAAPFAPRAVPFPKEWYERQSGAR